MGIAGMIDLICLYYLIGGEEMKISMKALVSLCLFFVSLNSSFTVSAEDELTVSEEQLYVGIPQEGQLWIGKKEARIGINHIIQDAAPYINEGSTVVPLKTISAITDTVPDWDPNKQEITFRIDETEVVVKIGSKEALVNGQLIKMTTAPFIKNNRTMIPLRFVSENLGGSVNFDKKDQSIIVEFSPLLLTESEVENFTNLEPFIIDGESMYPLFIPNERVIADIEYFRNNKPSKDDLVLFKTDKDKTYLKRVIALEGETVEVKNDRLFINGILIHEPYLEELKAEKKDKNPLTYDYGPITVQANEVFVLGDNRRFSKDSRIIGNVKTDKLIGKIITKYIAVKLIENN